MADIKKPLLSDYDEKEDSVIGFNEDKRKFTDILFGLLFLLCLGGFVVISGVGFQKGSPSYLIPSNEWSSQIQNKAEFWFQDAVAELKNNRDVLAGSLIVSLLISVVWLQLIKMFTKVFVYLTLVAGLATLCAASVLLLVKGIHQEDNFLKGCSYAGFALVAILLLVVFFLRKDIAMTCSLFKECCSAIQANNIGIYLVSGAIMTGLAAFICFWVAQFVYLYSIPQDTTITVSPDPRVPIQFNQSVRHLLWFQIFAGYWITGAIFGILEITIAGTVSRYYFERSSQGYFGSFRSFIHALTFHFGTISLSSLIVAILKFLHFMLRIASKDPRARILPIRIAIRLAQCIIGCFAALMKVLSQYALIYTAIHGYSFCEGSRKASSLLSRNGFSAVVVNTLGSFILFVGRLLCSSFCVFLAVIVFNALHRDLSFLSLSFVFVVSYLVFSFVSQIISIGVDTIFVCYLEDLEQNKHNPRLSQDLHYALQKKSKREQPIVN